MTLLCIGKSGQVARALAERAENNGMKLSCIGRPELDLLMPETVISAIEGESPSVVVNAAAYTNVDQAETDKRAAFALNADAAKLLARYTAEADIPIIHISTDYVFDGAENNRHDESYPTRPLNVYGHSKLAGEFAIRNEAKKHIILRTSWVFGPHTRNFVTTMIRLAKERGGASVVDDQIGAPTSALDIADAILSITKAIENKPNPHYWGTYHFASLGSCSWADFAALVFEVFEEFTGSTPTLNRILTENYPSPAARPKNSLLSTEKITEVFGIEPRHWKTAAEETTRRLLRESN